MRRAQIDALSQVVRNLATNPSFEASAGTTTIVHTNVARNPSFEKTSGTTDVRTNLFTNPAFEATSGMTDVRTNWIANPSFAASGAVVNVRTNLATNPAMEATSGTTAVRTNLAVNPRMTNFNFGGYGAQTLSSVNTGVTGHPEQITTAVRVSYSAGAGNPGVIVMPLPDVSTQYTVSAWVYNEGTATESIAIALKGVSSGGAQDVPVGVWTRLAWTMTTPATLGSGNDFGVRIGSPSASGSFLTTGVLIEKSPILGDYFDGTRAAHENLAKTATTALSGVTITTGIAYNGSTWSRASVAAGTGGWIARQYVALADIVNGETYTVSVTLANDTATATTTALDWCDVSGTTVTIQPGEVRRVKFSASKAVYDTVYRFADLQVNQDASGSRSILFKDWTIDHGTTDGTFYTGTGDFTYSWSGTANASISYQLAPTLTGWNASNTGASKTYQTTRYGITGKSVALSKAGGYVFLNISLSGLSPSASYTWSADVVSPQATINTVDRGPSGGIYSPSDRTVTPNVPTRISRTFTTGAGETTRQFSIAGWENASAPDGSTMYIDNALIEKSTLVQSYFDGSTAAAGDFTFAWAGTANASVSYQQAPTVANWQNRWFGSTGGEGVLYQAKGGISGTYARKLWTQANTGSAMDTGINTGATTAWASTTYTLSAWVRSSVDQVYQFYIDWKDSGGALLTSSRPTQTATIPANVWTRVAITSTSPANTTQAVFVIGPYNGASAMPAGSTIDFDNVMAEIYPSARDYFDGATPIKNYCVNPSFDTDTSGWTAAAMVAGHGRSATRSYTGSHSLWGVATDNLGDSMYTNTVAYDVDAGATYMASAYVWVPAGVVAANFRDGTRNLWAVAANGTTPSLVRSVNIDFTKTNQWQRVSVSIVIPTGSNKLNIRLYFPANSLGVYWDSILVEKSDTVNPYYEGQGGFTYGWLGAVNTSASVQQAPKAASIGAANQAVTYQIGTTGKYKNRISFNGTTIGDSGINFASGITTGASKTYTVSVDITADSNRMVKFSAQGTGVVAQNSANISLTAGVTTRQIWSFSTAASGSVALYILRADSLLGNVDLDHMLIEEGTIQNGGYFDGTKLEQNLVTNSNFEVNTTGWLPDTGNPTLSASTDRAYLGTRSLKAVSTVTGTDVAVLFSAALKASTIYTLSYYVYSVDARTSCYFDAASVNVNITRRGDTSIAAGTWKRISATFTTPENVGATTTFYLHQSGGPNVLGATVYIDSVLLEETEKLNQYYEGTGDFTYAWTGTAHASTSVQRGTAIDLTLSERAFAISTTRNGDKVVRVIPSGKGAGTMTHYTGNDVFINLIYQPQSLKANTTYTLVSTVTIEDPLSAPAKFRFNIDGIDQYSPALPTAVGEYTQNWQFTTGTNGTMNFLRFMPGPSGVAGYSNEVILNRVMIVEGTYTGAYFDGTTPTSTDFTYTWTGTAHNSTSRQNAITVSGIGGGNALPFQSGEWSASGTKSLRVRPQHQTSNATSTVVTGVDLEKGKTYTVLATRRLEAPLTGVLNSTYGGTVSLIQTGAPVLKSDVLPNIAGVGKIRWTFTVDPASTATTLRLGHGGYEGSGDVWWDDVMLVEGTYEGDYVDGSKPLAKWTGTENASTSVGYPPQFLNIAGNPVKDHSGTSAVATTNPPADTGPRTLYLVYESYGYASAYQNPGYYGVMGSGRATFQTQNANQNSMGIRFDFPSGDTNKVVVLGGGRNAYTRHVIAVTVRPALGTGAACIDGNPDVSFTFNGGTGWMGNDTHNLGNQSETKGLRLIVFHADHDRATRLAVSQYLGNKYAASIS